MISMWANDVGRHGASNLDVLKDIFELNMKLFNKNPAKKFLFILKDSDRTEAVMERNKAILKK